MCDRSNRPAAVRTARCSSRMPPYWIGISQPANSTIFAPSASWRSSSGVGERVAGVGRLGHRGDPLAWLRRAGNGAVRRGGGRRGATSARSVSKVSSVAASSNPIQRTSSNSWSWPPEVAAGGHHQEVVDGLVDARPALDEPVLDGVEGARRCRRPGRSPRAPRAGRSPRWSRRRLGVPLGSVQVTPSRSRLRLPTTSCGAPADEADDDATGGGGVGLLQARHAGATEGRRGPRHASSSSKTSADAGLGRPLRTGRAGATTSARQGARSASAARRPGGAGPCGRCGRP